MPVPCLATGHVLKRGSLFCLMITIPVIAVYGCVIIFPLSGQSSVSVSR